MGAIYASSKLTIIASDGDGMAGLPGINGCPASRNLTNMFSWNNDRVIVVRDLPLLNASKLQTKYFRRGWTFQEYALSRRRLIFGRQQIHWICACKTWHEDLHSNDAQLHKPNDEITQFSNTLRKWPDFKKLDGLLRVYNTLDMTYPEDTLPGIAGLLRLLNSSFHGGFLFGLPTMCFEAALLWHHHFEYNWSFLGLKQITVGRRKRSTRARSLLPDSELPSWSWVGWNGGCLSLLEDEEDYRVVTYPNHSLNNEVSRSNNWVTIPTTQWYCHDTPTCTKEQRVYSSWFETHQNTTHCDSLPEGWIREKYPGTRGPDIADMRSLPYAITGEFIYHHRESPNSLYWRPFPLSRSSNIHISHQIKQEKFISCKTKRGWFRYVRKTAYDMHTKLDYHLEILDAHDQHCGWIQLSRENEALPNLTRAASDFIPDDVISHSDIALDVPPSLGGISIRYHEHVELVVVCERLLLETVCWEGGWSWLDKRTYTHYYGVLLIEWDDNIAYRKSCGIIKKDMWDQHDRGC